MLIKKECEEKKRGKDQEKKLKTSNKQFQVFQQPQSSLHVTSSRKKKQKNTTKKIDPLKSSSVPKEIRT